MRFAFIHAMIAEKAPFTITAMCLVLDVTRQGYHAYKRSLQSPRLADEATLQERIAKIHAESRGTYGCPRICEQLRREGFKVSKRRVERKASPEFVPMKQLVARNGRVAHLFVDSRSNMRGGIEVTSW